jgi:hypothetical protein
MVHRAFSSKEFPITLGTPVRRADPSTVPATLSHHGVIQVIDTINGTVLGCVSKSSLKRAQLRYQPTIDSALIVTFETDLTGSGTNLNIVMTVCFYLSPNSPILTPPCV